MHQTYELFFSSIYSSQNADDTHLIVPASLSHTIEMELKFIADWAPANIWNSTPKKSKEIIIRNSEKMPIYRLPIQLRNTKGWPDGVSWRFNPRVALLCSSSLTLTTLLVAVLKHSTPFVFWNLPGCVVMLCGMWQMLFWSAASCMPHLRSGNLLMWLMASFCSQ